MADYPDILKREHLTNEERKCICNQLMTTESHMERLILKHFTDEDFRKVWERKIGGGVIGGKACGLLVARKLIEGNMPQYSGHIEPHNSFLSREMKSPSWYSFPANLNFLLASSIVMSPQPDTQHVPIPRATTAA